MALSFNHRLFFFRLLIPEATRATSTVSDLILKRQQEIEQENIQNAATKKLENGGVKEQNGGGKEENGGGKEDDAQNLQQEIQNSELKNQEIDQEKTSEKVGETSNSEPAEPEEITFVDLNETEETTQTNNSKSKQQLKSNHNESKKNKQKSKKGGTKPNVAAKKNSSTLEAS